MSWLNLYFKHLCETFPLLDAKTYEKIKILEKQIEETYEEGGIPGLGTADADLGLQAFLISGPSQAPGKNGRQKVTSLKIPAW